MDSSSVNLGKLNEYRKLIAWAIKRRLILLDLTLESAVSIEDLIQETYLRLIASISRREGGVPAHLPSYVVKAARRTVTEYARRAGRKKNKPDRDVASFVGRVNRNRRLRIARGALTAKDKQEQARAASNKRWEKHSLSSTEAQRAKH